MPNYNNIMDLIAEGIRSTNPIYREKQEKLQQQQAETARITQQQLFQQQQNNTNRNSLTEFERQNLARQDQDRQQVMKEHYEGAVASGKAIRTDVNGIPEDQSLGATPMQKATGTPPATGPADNATNGMGGAGGNGPQGALQPTGAAATSAPSGGIGDSGGGPSASPLWDNPFKDILPQGPLTGGVGAAPAGNTSANTQQSRSSSAQAGPLAQISQGSVNPVQTASGQTGMDSGTQPADVGTTPFAVRKPDVSLPDGSHYRFLTPQEQDVLVQRQARANARTGRQQSLEDANTTINDPANKDYFSGPVGQQRATELRMKAVNNYVPPAITLSQQQANLSSALDDANQRGDTQRAEQIRMEMAATHPTIDGVTSDPATRLSDARRYAMTGTMPPNIGRNGQQSRQIREDANKFFPNEDPMANSSFYTANKKSMNTAIPVFDAIDQYERTAKDNIDNSMPLLDKVVNSGVPWINRPLREINVKALGDQDIPAYNAASKINANEIARILSMASANPGVLSDASRTEAENLINAKDATPAQLLKTYKVLRTDMQNRRAEAGQQIQDIQSRTGKSANELRQWFGSAEEAPTSGTSDVRNVTSTAGDTGKVADKATLIKYVTDAKGDKVQARKNLIKDGFTIP